MYSKRKNFFTRNYPKILAVLFFIALLSSYVRIFAISSSYAPGATLDPACVPGETNCYVSKDFVSTFGAEQAPTLTTGNWTLGAGWAYATSPDRLDKNAAGLGNATPTAATTIVVGTTYKVIIVVDSTTYTAATATSAAGNATYTLGGVSGSPLIAAGTYTDYITAIRTDKLSIASSFDTTMRITISYISIIPMVNATGDLTIDGDLTAKGPISFSSNINLGSGSAFLKANQPFIHDFNYGYNGTITTDGYNTFIGVNSGNFTMGSTATADYEASYNTAIGTFSLAANTKGFTNTAIGSFALRNNTIGNYNNAIGTNALMSNTTGNQNISIGSSSSKLNTTGYNNSVVGTSAYFNSVNGTYNTIFGYRGMYTTTGGSGNTALGYQSMYSAKPTTKAITAFADYSGTVPGTVMATSAGHTLQAGTTVGVVIYGTTNYDGTYTVTYIDANSFYFTKAFVATETGTWNLNTETNYNTAIGYESGKTITTGTSNTAIGYWAGYTIGTGSGNVMLGNYAGKYETGSNSFYVDNQNRTNTAGDKAGALLYGTFNATPASQTLKVNGSLGIGVSPSYKLDVLTDGASSYVSQLFNDGNNDNRYGLLIQAGADAPGTGKWIQFNDGDGGDVGTISRVGATLTLTTTSDERLKENIIDTGIGLNELARIKVRDFSFISDEKHIMNHGFIAQELNQVYPDAVVIPSNPDEYWKVSYSQLTPLIVKSIQDLNLKVEGIASLNPENPLSVGSLIKQFLADINGIFVKKICIDDGTCLDQNDIRNLRKLLDERYPQVQTQPLVEIETSTSPETTPEVVPETVPNVAPEIEIIQETNSTPISIN